MTTILRSTLLLSVLLSSVTSAAFAGTFHVPTRTPTFVGNKLPVQPVRPPSGNPNGGVVSGTEGSNPPPSNTLPGGGLGDLGGLCDEVKCISPK
jgi:hypothetical protein